MKIPKITIIGAGRCGMSCAFSILQKPNCCSEMVLIDLDERKVTGEVLDLQNGAVFLSGVKIRGGTEYSLMHGSDIVIVTAGARKIAGESMENLINKNVQNMRTIMCAISRMAPNSIILMVSNPVEAMTYVAWKLSGFPAERVIGAGTTADSARYRQLLASKTGEPVESITGMVLGGSGEFATPIWSSVTICGGRSNDKLKAILEDFPEKIRLREALVHSAREIQLLKGYDNWAIGLATAEIVESLCSGVNHVLQVTTCSNGKYKLNAENVFISLPVELSHSGVKRIIEIEINEEEQAKLEQVAHELSRVQKKIPVESGVNGTLQVDRSDYVGCPPHSPRIHRKVAMFEHGDQAAE